MALSRRLRGFMRPALAATLALFSGIAGNVGCLNRPLEPNEPKITSTVQEKLPQSKIKKIDLLLMIDNSASMGDKQAILASAVPDLVRGLVSPLCVDDSGVPAASQPKLTTDACPAKTFREFDAITDIHVGLISSSLGSRGANGCAVSPAAPAKDDHAHLLARTEPGKGSALKDQDVATYNEQGFLAWDPGKKLQPNGIATLGDMSGAPGIVPVLAEMVTGIGQDGCGYESQLESWYRFLVDPEPYQSIALKNGSSTLIGSDAELLAERKAFLRPDSLVAIILLTDENDCSLKDVGKAFNAAELGSAKSPYHLPRARHECSINVDDPCCKSCTASLGSCAEDPTCKEPWGPQDDQSNLRCYDQKKRFGIDFLYPLDRYTSALTSARVPNRAGELVQNPLFPEADPDHGILAPRTADGGLVFLAGIVGVPWQDIARRSKEGIPDLRTGLNKDKKPVGGFKNARELDDRDEKGRSAWDQILGNPAKKIPAADPLMRESRLPRSGNVPSTGEDLATEDATSAKANSINGHEWDTLKSVNGDLQYACTFPLPVPKVGCTGSTCDCNTDAKNPLCQDDAGNYTTTQLRAKAYPGVRELGVLKEIGDQGIVASVCPAQLDHPEAEYGDYGYRPATGAIVDRLKSRLTGACLHRSLQPDPSGQVECLILEARQIQPGESCNCNAPEVKARQDVQPEHEEARRVALDDEVAKAAGWNCFCEVKQLGGDELHACQFDTSHDPGTKSGPADGWCYIDAASTPPAGDPSLVATCAPTEQRKLRFVGQGQPLDRSTLFITCSGE
ncbi:MAG: hypothetical protein ABJE95_27700 [Byssovorax sp.]